MGSLKIAHVKMRVLEASSTRQQISTGSDVLANVMKQLDHGVGTATRSRLACGGGVEQKAFTVNHACVSVGLRQFPTLSIRPKPPVPVLPVSNSRDELRGPRRGAAVRPR